MVCPGRMKIIGWLRSSRMFLMIWWLIVVALTTSKGKQRVGFSLFSARRHNPPPSPRCSFGEIKTSRDASSCLGATQVSVRLAPVQDSFDSSTRLVGVACQHSTLRCAITTSPVSCLSRPLAMSSHIYLLFSPRSHKPPPTLCSIYIRASYVSYSSNVVRWLEEIGAVRTIVLGIFFGPSQGNMLCGSWLNFHFSSIFFSEIVIKCLKELSLSWRLSLPSVYYADLPWPSRSHLSLQRRRFTVHRYAKRPDVALYAIGPLRTAPSRFPKNIAI